MSSPKGMHIIALPTTKLSWCSEIGCSKRMANQASWERLGSLSVLAPGNRVLSCLPAPEIDKPNLQTHLKWNHIPPDKVKWQSSLVHLPIVQRDLHTCCPEAFPWHVPAASSSPFFQQLLSPPTGIYSYCGLLQELTVVLLCFWPIQCSPIISYSRFL